MPQVRSEKKIIYNNNIDMVSYIALIDLLARVPDREIPNLLRLREERREIKNNIVVPKKSVKELVQFFEDTMSKLPLTPPPRRRRVAQLTQLKSALKGYNSSFQISLVFTKDQLRQMQKSRQAISEMLSFLLRDMKYIKFSE